MIKAIVTDIEGTTSSIDFVHQTLFPYAKQHMRGFLHAHAQDSVVQKLLEEVERLEHCSKLTVDEAADVLERWITEDRKITPLKTLQGMIWKIGYESGELKGHVYADVPECLRRWHAEDKKLYVYSSGSVAAQKLIFGHTDFGDLTRLFSGYFDTAIGGKRDSASYRVIVNRLELAPNEILFLSDVGEELDAAQYAGMRTCQLRRDDKVQPAIGHPQVRSFEDVDAGEG